MPSPSIIFFQYICPLFGAIFANLMFSAPIRDVHLAVKQGSLGHLNPTPWAVMTGNCTGWIVYSFLLQNWFIFWANAPGLIISIWLNMAAAKLQYCDRLSQDIRCGMVSFLKENSHLLGESTMNMSLGDDDNGDEADSTTSDANSNRNRQEPSNDANNDIAPKRVSFATDILTSPPSYNRQSSVSSSTSLASTAVLLQQFCQIELKEEDDDPTPDGDGDGGESCGVKDEEMGGGHNVSSFGTSPPTRIAESNQSTTTRKKARRTTLDIARSNKNPIITSKSGKLLGVSNAMSAHSSRFLEIMEYADVHATPGTPAIQREYKPVAKGRRSPVSTASPPTMTPPTTGNPLERLTRVAYDITVQKSEAPAPHERTVVAVVAIWLILIATISLFNLTLEQRLAVIGVSVNLNISFFYGAPLSTIVKVISTRNSSSIHRWTMMLNTGCALFFLLFGIGVRDNYLIVPNGIGVALGVIQMILRTVIPNQNNMYVEEDKALLAIRGFMGLLYTSIISLFVHKGKREVKKQVEDDNGRLENNVSNIIESSDELNNNSIVSNIFLQSLTSPTSPSKSTRGNTDKNGLDELDDHSVRSEDFLHYLYFTPSNTL